MSGACIIDGTDISTLGMFIVKGGDDDFVSYPSRREPTQNDWFEYDGLEIDWDSLTFKSKTVKVQYYIAADDKTTFNNHLNAFKNLHLASGLREIYIREFDRTFNLQYVKVTDYKHSGGLYKSGKKYGYITIEYADNDPVSLFSSDITEPAGGNGITTQVLVNNVDFSNYGIIIKEFYSTALKFSSPKQGIAVESAYIDGVVVDTDFTPTKQSRQFTIECSLLSDSLDEFWQNYTALFNVLSAKESIELSLTNGEVITCYYSSMDNCEKMRPFNQKIHLGFNLKFKEL